MQGKRVSYFVAAALACAAFVGVLSLPVPQASQLRLGGPASAEESIDISYFYDKLAPYGLWVEHPRFGYVWLPQDVSEEWRPYTVGHWINTKYGWYWESEEPFAWAVYHYGRWGYDPELGWFWVPGTIWAPAWVEWRYPKKASKKSYVGWAPVGPRLSGYAYGVEDDYEPPVAEAWVFVEPEYIIAEDVYVYAVPVVEIDIDYIETTVVYQPRYRGGIVYNKGIPHDHVEAIIGQEIETREFVRVEDPNAVAVSDDKVQAFAPRVEKAKPGMAPQQVAKSPDEIKPKAKLKTSLQEVPKDLGPTASELKPGMKEGVTKKEAEPEPGAEPSEPDAPGKTGKEEAPQPPSTDVLGEKEKGPEAGKKKEEPEESEAAGKAETPTEPSGPSGAKKGKEKGEIGSTEQPSPPSGPSAPKKGKQKGKVGSAEQPSAPSGPSGQRSKPKGDGAMLDQDEEGPGPSGPGSRKKGKGKSAARSGPSGDDISPSAGPSRRGEGGGPNGRGRFSEGGPSGGASDGPATGGEHGGKKGRVGEAEPSGGSDGPGGGKKRGPGEPG